MDDKLIQEMMLYYEVRAPEYDEVYLGKGPSIPEPASYIRDVEKISELCRIFGNGHLIDIGCGTGFWLPYYANNCTRITLIDQSEEMLGECRKRIAKLSPAQKFRLLQGDFFKVHIEGSIYDSALVAFFISHLIDELELLFFKKLKKILKPDASIMWIDSVWSEKRKSYREKEGLQQRKLNDGRTFTIYKRYFDKCDIEKLFEKHLFKLGSLYFGDVFFAVTGKI